MAIPTRDQWTSGTSRWWARRSRLLETVDNALDAYNHDRSHNRFLALASALEAWMQSKTDWTKSTRNIGWNANVVTNLVKEIAASQFWRGVRSGTSAWATAKFFRKYASGRMATYNQEFITDPEVFLRQYSVYCYNVGEKAEGLSSYGVSNDQVGGATAIGFEFLREQKRGTHVSLEIADVLKGGEHLIRGGWIPYRGQSAQPNPDLFGHLAILDPSYNYIFTVGLGGCRIAVVRAPDRIIHMYHEPTQKKWGKDPNYDGELIAYCSPDYSRVNAGFCCFEKTGKQWRALVQEFGGGGTVERLVTIPLGI